MLLMSQVVLWDISFHIPHLQGTRPNSKKASDSDSDSDSDAFVSTHNVFEIVTVLMQWDMLFCTMLVKLLEKSN